jgi:hypothetical protein
MPSSPIPYGYRLWFGTLEPIMGLTGFYFNHVTPTYLLQTLNPSYNTLAPITPETRLLLDMTTGCYAQNWFLQIVLPRARPDDLGLWKIWQGSLLVVDCVLLGAVLRNLAVLGVLETPGAWTAEQRGNLGVMCALVAIRSAFVLGIGLGGREEPKKKD